MYYSWDIVELINQGNHCVQATLTCGLTPRVLGQYQSEWLPKLRAVGAEDAHWDWQLYWNNYRNDSSQLFFALECESKLQGMQWLSASGYASRLTHSPKIVYIQRLCAAPWNRGKSSQRLFRPVGMVLLRNAVLKSIEVGFNGRIGLHSLAGAAHWYRDTLRLTGFGPDPEHEGLEYFEFTEEQARRLLRLNE
jgi:hypothetical protein